MDYGGVLTTSISASMAAFCLTTRVSPERLREVLAEAYLADGDGPNTPEPPCDGNADRTSTRETSLGHLIADLETGRLAPDRFESLLATALSVGLAEPLAPAGLIHRLFSTVVLDDRMLRAVGRIRRQGVKAGVLSNTWGRSVFHPEVLERFDAVVLSEREGLRKPDPRIYRVAAQRLGLQPGDCVFVDDMAANVEGARAVGMVGVLHKHPDLTIRRLAELLAVDLDGA